MLKSNIREEYYSLPVRESLARRLVRRWTGKPLDFDSQERSESGAVADKRHSASLGERCQANSQLEVLRPRRVPNLRRWHGLVAVDDS